MILTLELPPPLNSIYYPFRNKIKKTEDAQVWQTMAGWRAKQMWKKPPSAKYFIAMIHIYYKFDRDSDASEKLLFDAFEGVIYIHDSQVVSHRSDKHKDFLLPRLEVDIQEIDQWR